MDRLTRRINGKVSYAPLKKGECVDIVDLCDVWGERLADYEDAEEQGLLVRLPCKAEGADLFFVDLYSHEIYKEAYTNGIGLYWTNTNDLGDSFPLSCLGKTVFLTHEEAEKALEEAIKDREIG